MAIDLKLIQFYHNIFKLYMVSLRQRKVPKVFRLPICEVFITIGLNFAVRQIRVETVEF